MIKIIRQHYSKLILVLLSFLIGYLISPPKGSSPQEIRLKGNYKYINPLLECDSDFSNLTNLGPLRDRINKIIDDKTSTNTITRAAVYFRDMNNGPWFGINEKDDFAPASLIKVPMMIAYYKLAESDPSLLEKEITNTLIDDAKYVQNVMPSVTLTPNKTYTVDELIYIMIVHSDNLAYQLLLENIDNSLIFQIYHDMGINIKERQESGNPAGDILSVKDYASFFRVLYNSSYLNNEMSEKALELLSKSAYKNGLIAGVPLNIEISHKFGERQFIDTQEKQLHDCGIVHLPQKQYLLCIMTKGHDFNKLSDVIKTISSEVFTEINNKKTN